MLAALAATLVRYIEEKAKPDAERLDGFHDSQLAGLELRLFSPAPVYPALEEVLLADSLQESLGELGPSDPFNAAVLKGRTPDAVAKEAIGGTKLADPAARKALAAAGPAGVAASTDPLVVLARTADPFARKNQKMLDDQVASVETEAGEKIGRARFAVYGHSTYPDATFTLRLSYGQVKGYPMNGTIAPPKTTMFGLYDRANAFDNKPPFQLPRRYVERRAALDLSTPMNFVTDQRHHRRQFGIAGRQSQRRDRRPHLRREHREPRRPLRLQRGEQPLGRRPQRGDHRSAPQVVRRRRDRGRAAGEIERG